MHRKIRTRARRRYKKRKSRERSDASDNREEGVIESKKQSTYYAIMLLLY